MSDSLPELSPAELSRYSRHILLEQIGLDGQRRLAAARVLVIGAGGLGSPAALYLAAAGIGTLGIADLDKVELHNLQRQLLHEDAGIGEAKVTSAARRLHSVNPHVRVITHPEGVTPENAAELVARYDVVVDGTDNFTARYMNNDAAYRTGRPLVFGSVFKFEGQVAVFDPARGGPCYRCLFPSPPERGSVPGCGDVGVLGAVCGVVGSLQALEVIKLITGVGTPLREQLLTYDALSQSFQQITLARDPACPLCSRPPDGRSFSNPAVGPNSVRTTEPLDSSEYPIELSAPEVKARLDAAPDRTLLIDVREPWETQIVRVPDAELIPLRLLPDRLATLPRDRHLFVMCHHGGRSRKATDYLRTHGFVAATNIAGGIATWAEQVDPSLARY